MWYKYHTMWYKYHIVWYCIVLCYTIPYSCTSIQCYTCTVSYCGIQNCTVRSCIVADYIVPLYHSTYIFSSWSPSPQERSHCWRESYQVLWPCQRRPSLWRHHLQPSTKDEQSWSYHLILHYCLCCGYGSFIQIGSMCVEGTKEWNKNSYV